MKISDGHAADRLAGTLVHADRGSANSKLYFFDTPEPPVGGADPGGTPLVIVTLAKPCAVITNGVATLVQADPAGDMISSSGVAVWARQVNGDGVWMADGSVSDSAGLGDFKLAGTSGTTLYAGGRLLIGVCSLA